MKKLSSNKARICNCILFAIMCGAVLGKPSKCNAQDVIPTCHTWDGTTRDSARNYLKQDRATLEPACIYKAIELLKRDHTPSTRAILFDYIDWRRELPPKAPRVMTMGPTGGDYPAADALAFNGDDSLIPKVKAIMRSEDKNSKSRINAARVYFKIKPSPPTIAFIADTARNAGDRQSGNELEQLAAALVKYCYKAEDECQRAFNNPTDYLNK